MDKNDLDNLLFWSFRHGISSPANSVVQITDMLIKYKFCLSVRSCNLITVEIDSAILGKKAVLEQDVDKWRNVQEELHKLSGRMTA